MESHGVLPLTTIGVLLSTTRTARGISISIDGSQDNDSKDSTYYVRPVRAF